MNKENVTLKDLKQLTASEGDYKDFVTLSHYLQQSPSNRVQYLYEAPDGSLVEVDIFATEDGILRKSAVMSFDQSVGFPMDVSLDDLDSAIKHSKQQVPLRYQGICSTRWFEIKFLVGEM